MTYWKANSLLASLTHSQHQTCDFHDYIKFFGLISQAVSESEITVVLQERRMLTIKFTLGAAVQPSLLKASVAVTCNCGDEALLQQKLLAHSPKK